VTPTGKRFPAVVNFQLTKRGGARLLLGTDVSAIAGQAGIRFPITLTRGDCWNGLARTFVAMRCHFPKGEERTGETPMLVGVVSDTHDRTASLKAGW
jgi:hypothetical protein